MKKLLLLIIIIPSFIQAEELILLCEGKREFSSYIEGGMNINEVELALLKLKKDSMVYIGLNSGRKYIFGNKEYTAPKRSPHEDIKIKELYEVTSETISASQTITDMGSSDDSAISAINVLVNRLTGELNEVDNMINKKTLKVMKSNKFEALCKRRG